MKAAFYECDITPPLGEFMWGYYTKRIAEDVYEKLYAKALVVEDEGRYAAIVDVDVCTLTPEMHDIVTKRIFEYTGITPDCVCISANHTHRGAAIHDDAPIHCFADESYKNVFYRLVADSVILAYKRLDSDEITIKYGKTKAEGLAFCRTAALKNGTYITHPSGREDIDHLLSKPDSDLSILLFEKNGIPVGALTNFSLHQDTTYLKGYTGDYSSALSDNLKNKFGREFVSLFILGACGDVNDVNPDPNFKCELDEYTHRYYYHRHIGKKLFEHIDNMLDYLEEIDGSVSNKKEKIKIQRRTFKGGRLAEETKEHIEKYNNPLLTLSFLSYHLSNSENETDLYIQVIKLGDVIICALPGENFVETGYYIKKHSPYPRTIVATNCNSYTGYIPTKDLFGNQSNLYEISTCYHSNLVPEASEQLCHKAVEIIKNI